MSEEKKRGRVGMLTELRYIFDRRDKGKIMMLLLAVVVGSFLELLGVTVFMPFIETIQKPQTIQEKWYLKWIYDQLHMHSATEFMILLSGCIILVYLVKNVYLVIEKSYIYRFSYHMQRKLSTRLLNAYMKAPYTFHLYQNIATLQRTLQEDTSRFIQVVLYSLELIAELAVCFVLGTFLLIESKTITIIVLGLLVVCLGLFLLLTRKYSRRLGEQNQKCQGTIFQWMNQALGGVKEIKILERSSYFTEEYSGYYTKYASGLTVARTISILPKYVMEAVAIGGLLIAIIVKLRFGEADMTYYVSQLTVFAVAAFRLMPSVGRINEHTTNTLYALPSVDLIYHDLKEIEEYGKQQDHEVREDWNLERGVEVRHVTYRYPGTDEPVIEDASLFIEKGKTIAFVGASGAGKTTMVDIILGLLAPQKGVVMADGINVHEKPKTFHAQVGYIPQVIYLSDDTIRSNIAFGIKEKDIDEQAVRRAVEMAQLSTFIDSLPHGLDTIVGDRGVRLSGGQRQRIGIARALYHDPEILVLDEATSALDNETESAVMEAVENLQGTKTMIIIAHRLTTIRNVDKIYEVAGGRVAEKSKEEVFGEHPAEGTVGS